VPTDVVLLSLQRLGDSRLGCQQALEGNKPGFRRGRYVTSGTPLTHAADGELPTFTSALPQQPVRYSQSTEGKPADTGLHGTSADNTSLWPTRLKVSRVPQFSRATTLLKLI
jgi:hypothetical protein